MNIHINNMIRCKNCGRLIPSDSSSCRYCGDEITNAAVSDVTGNVGKLNVKKRTKIALFTILGIFALFTIISVINSMDFKSTKNVKTEQPPELQNESVQTPTVQNEPVQHQVYNDTQEPEYESNSGNVKVIDNPYVENAPNKMRVKIVRISMTDEYTAIFCAIDNTKGSYSYIAIDSETYICVNGSEFETHQLAGTDGIGISPQKTAIPKGQITPFVLYFPAIYKDADFIDLEEAGKNGWKFYGIHLK